MQHGATRSTTPKKEDQEGTNNVAVRQSTHRMAKAASGILGLKIGDFCTDAIDSHIIRKLTPEQVDLLVQQQKRGSKRKAGKISKK